MKLSITIEVEVPGEDVKTHVPYIKHLLIGKLANVGIIKGIFVDGEQSKWLSDRAERVEKEAYYRGEIKDL